MPFPRYLPSLKSTLKLFVYLFSTKYNKGPFTNYVYKRRGVGGQKNRLFVNFYTIEIVNLWVFWVGGQKKPNLVNEVCERPLILQLDDGAGILRQLYPGLRQNIYVELAEAFKTYETLRRIRDVSAARGLPKNDFRIMMRRSEASPLDTIDEYGRVIKKRSEPR